MSDFPWAAWTGRRTVRPVTSQNTCDNCARTDDDLVEVHRVYLSHNAYGSDDVIEMEDLERWCPSCFVDGQPRPEVAHLPGHLAALEGWYAHEDFRVHRSRQAASYRPASPAPAEPAAQRAVRASRYLRRFMRLPPEPVAVSRAGAP